jgi:hypothetical protein
MFYSNGLIQPIINFMVQSLLEKSRVECAPLNIIVAVASSKQEQQICVLVILKLEFSSKS